MVKEIAKGQVSSEGVDTPFALGRALWASEGVLLFRRSSNTRTFSVEPLRAREVRPTF